MALLTVTTHTGDVHTLEVREFAEPHGDWELSEWLTFTSEDGLESLILQKRAVASISIVRSSPPSA